MQNNYDKNELVYAGFFARLGAHIIDAIVVGVFLLIVRIPLAILGGILPENAMSGNVIFQYSLTAIVLYICKVFYYTLLTYHDGRTFGKRAMNLKVVSQDGTPLQWMNVLYRESVGKFLSGIIIYIGYLMIGVDDEKRALHDRLCDTYVVYEKRIKVIKTVKTVQSVSANSVKQAIEPGTDASDHAFLSESMDTDNQRKESAQGSWIVSKKPAPMESQKEMQTEAQEETKTEPQEEKYEAVKEGDSQGNDETGGL